MISYLLANGAGGVQLMARRHDDASAVRTRNEVSGEWGEISGDEVVAAALIDRLLHRCRALSLRGDWSRVHHDGGA